MQISDIHHSNEEFKSKEENEDKGNEIKRAIENYKKNEILSEITIQKYRNKIRAGYIQVCSYNYTMGVKTQLINDNGYLSTPSFVFSLTNLWNIILTASNREEALFNGLQKINMHLPAAVYIPFVNASMRNYVVLHINILEAKVFITKERAPFLIWIEVFRPEENKFKDEIEEIDESTSSDNENEELQASLELKERTQNHGKPYLIHN